MSTVRAQLLGLFVDAIARQDPARKVREHLAEGEALGEDITLLALGKSAVPMAEGACEFLGTRVRECVVVAPVIPKGKGHGWLASSHPTPTNKSEIAGRGLLDAAARAKGQVLALISGGGSSLAAVPVPGLALADKAALIARLAAAGAPIAELNLVRSQLSAIKGGRLAQASPTPVHSLILSDVVGDSLEVIASGPTVVRARSSRAALAIVQRYLGQAAGGPAIAALALPEQKPPAQRRSDTHVLLAGFDAFADSTQMLAEERGFEARRLPRFEGPVAAVAEGLLSQVKGPGLWIAGGEATVVLPAKPGQGGRAQQLALLLAQAIRGTGDSTILVAGSDGIDGNSQAAGAIVDGRSIDEIGAAGFALDRVLGECDAAPALAAIGAQICTGPTGVNHADLVLIHRR